MKKKKEIFKKSVIDIVGSKYIIDDDDNLIKGYEYDGDYHIKFDRWDKYNKILKTKKNKKENIKIDGLESYDINNQLLSLLYKKFRNWVVKRAIEYFKISKCLNTEFEFPIPVLNDD